MNLTDVKACIKAVLSSTKNDYTLRELLQDFELMSGEHLPLFNYKNPVEFLKSIPDTVQVNGSMENPRIQLVRSEKSNHIYALVKRQKTNKKPGHQRFINSNQFLLGSNNMHYAVPRQYAGYGIERTKSFSTGRIHKLRQNDYPARKPNVGMSQQRGTGSTNMVFEHYDTLLNENNNNSTTDDSLEDIHHSKVLNSTAAENVKANGPKINSLINENVRAKLGNLIKEHPKGLWCCELPVLYFQKYNYNLDFREYGYTSLINMLSEMPDIFRYERPGSGDWILFDATLPSSAVEKTLLDLKSAGSQVSELRQNVISPSDCRNDQDFAFDRNFSKHQETRDSAFPNDVVKFSDQLPQINVKRHIKGSGKVKVCTAEIYTPSKFYIHLEKFKNHLTYFMTDLQKFYNRYPNKYKIPDFLLRENQFCVAFYRVDNESPEEWHRAQIIKVYNERILSVSLVDFGTVVTVKRTQVRFLHRIFKFFPVQGLLAGMADIDSPDGPNKWSVKACARFLELTRSPLLEAEIVSLGDENKLNVVLHYPPEENKPSVNKQLIDEHLAVALGDEGVANAATGDGDRQVRQVEKVSTGSTDGEKRQDRYTKSNASHRENNSILSDSFKSQSSNRSNVTHFSGDRVKGMSVSLPTNLGTTGSIDGLDQPNNSVPSSAGSSFVQSNVQTNVPRDEEELKRQINLLSAHLLMSNPNLLQVAVFNFYLATSLANQMAEILLNPSAFTDLVRSHLVAQESISCPPPPGSSAPPDLLGNILNMPASAKKTSTTDLTDWVSPPIGFNKSDEGSAMDKESVRQPEEDVRSVDSLTRPEKESQSVPCSTSEGDSTTQSMNESSTLSLQNSSKFTSKTVEHVEGSEEYGVVLKFEGGIKKQIAYLLECLDSVVREPIGNLKHVRQGKICDKVFHTVQLPLQNKIYYCVEEILKVYTALTSRNAVSRKKYKQFRDVSYNIIDINGNESVINEIKSCKVPGIFKFERRQVIYLISREELPIALEQTAGASDFIKADQSK